MAIDVFGEAMYHNIGPMLKRPAQGRRGHGVIDDHRHPGPVSCIGNPPQVRHC